MLEKSLPTPSLAVIIYLGFSNLIFKETDANGDATGIRIVETGELRG